MWLDAHTHLQDPRLARQTEAWLPCLTQLPIRCAVVNGTSESDWPEVAKLANQHPWIRPAFGLHPWHVGKESEQWFDHLKKLLLTHPRATIGEIGLDRWIQPRNFPAQIQAFEPQIALAAELDRPASIHCLRAWGTLRNILSRSRLPSQGFLLHAYGGPKEMIQEFESLGAYFSFSPAFLHPAKTGKRALFLEMSPERILVETDAPDMAPPSDCNPFLLEPDEGRILNHPCNLQRAYDGLARLLHMDPQDLHTQVDRNFERLFGF